MKVCVTGAAGFIGRHVCAELYRRGHTVRAMDVTPCSLAQGVWIPADITKPLDRIPDLDAVIHLAAVANPRECDANPTKAFDVNVNGTHQVLKMALESGAKRVVFSSTAHVYGISPHYLPTPETHPLWLQNNYTLTKILGEQLCQLYHENHGLSYAALRLYNAYGPGQAQGYFIPDMLAKAKGGDFKVQGANTTKDWVHISDVAQAFVRALETQFVGPINVGTGVETDLATIAHTIADVHGVTCEEAYDPNATRMCADNSRAKRILGWQPTVSVEDGLHALCNETKPQPVR